MSKNERNPPRKPAASEEPALPSPAESSPKRKRYKSLRIDSIGAVGPRGAVLLWRRATDLEIKLAQLAWKLVADAWKGAVALASNLVEAGIRHAPDFSWVTDANCTRYDFCTTRQREIIGVLFRRWQAGGDGAFASEAAILEELGEKIGRLRVGERFKGHPAVGTVLRRRPGNEAAWALYLDAPGK